jgi:hypothetical protein
MAALIFLLVVIAVVAIYKHIIKKKSIPLGLKSLPGPKGKGMARCTIVDVLTVFLGIPILGCALEVPEKLGWIKFADWHDQYGPIYQVDLAGTNHVWISRDDISRDLLAKKAAIYSDRPHIPALIDDNRSSGQYLPLMSRNGTSSSSLTIRLIS